MNVQLKSNLIFLSILLLCTLVLLNMGLYITHTLYGLQYTWGIFNCLLKITIEFSQLHFLFHIGSFILIIYTFLRVCIRIFKQITLTLKWNRYFNENEHSLSSKHIKAKYSHSNSEICVIEHPGFIALTIGIFKPRIILSTFVLTQFDEQEIEAIILHEQYHFKNYDPLKVFLVTLILDAINYIPIIKILVHHYKICKELMADQYAISKMNSSFGLSKALLKINRIKKNIPVSIGIGFTNSTMNFRIKQILEPENLVYFPFDYIKPLIKSFIIFALMSLVFIG
ncbi:M56 family peptidase [Paenibacillus psychroresistens]|uniref:M56 family peptidase n=1 Tax=Paenibacillus psychroresistens TaxID=1778678 RepID=A0A6B8RGL5_9BACL|nr:M56 family metallopeptidase [Paenibacillus psychroresistens]QGQ94673.1 M56 family peptidase [Paenibacillus psychroresistens]